MINGNALTRDYWIVPLPARLMQWAARIAHRRTPLTAGQRTTGHDHKFLSFYFVNDVKFLRTRRGDVPLPDRAMVIVFPFSVHSWSNREGAATGFVYDLTPAHGPHALEG